MAKTSPTFQLKWLWNFSRRNRPQGFTLIELLIVTIIAAGIITGLLYMVIELMGSDQREASRNETQRELQRAMDYMSNEMREAIYVYTGECLQGQGALGVDSPPFCPGLTPYLPAALSTESIPVVAFWRQQQIPTVLRNQCGAANNPALATVPCLTTHSYALVVYSLSTANTGNLWKGRARITRYALTQFDERTGAPTVGYVSPAQAINFGGWPFGRGANNTVVNLQAQRPTGNPAVLVDFVDDGRGAQASGIPSLVTNAVCPNSAATPGIDYSLSPTTTALNNAGLGNARTSFYACVSTIRDTDPGVNQDSILFVRGNARGRPGIATDRAFLPTLETRVLSRGILDRDPSAE
ncbi:prepilin-type N-terminal cleavage/methylation domain-containing protein [Oscillatoria sp. FACHB-1407]|uniref:prepilin-type N-terminal cleavage/methylation domain-containing protein n=1 Tax=Oscillatoria sp. FACHB-1407 TaxID=2692847 RepID=UPI00168625A8|nr:prepilin-type N-terminal cleavage/methylation domain-containing protein [Oscillatoria sp. FACHB-1407]MBD2462850.1 prepilin-type N-terminal cleavage/methylation domain-containing protein [Oscillatoria sp. FACHB-1407]